MCAVFVNTFLFVFIILHLRKENNIRIKFINNYLLISMIESNAF